LNPNIEDIIIFTGNLLLTQSGTPILRILLYSQVIYY